MEQVFEGYAPKSIKNKIFRWEQDGNLDILQVGMDFFPIYKTPGRKSSWNEEDYPPVKIKITVEIDNEK